METIEVEKIAEAVLYEGYLLYPYRRSALKNQQRWTFGGVYPRDYSEATGGDDPWLMQTQVLLSGDADTEVEVKVRFLHVADRKVAELVGGEKRFVDELQVAGQVYRPWEEAIERTIIVGPSGKVARLRLGDLVLATHGFEVAILAGSEDEVLLSTDGRDVGRLVREWRTLCGAVEITAEQVETTGNEAARSREDALYRLTVRVVNSTTGAEGYSSRTDVIRHTFVSTHTILKAHRGEFVSLLEPPPGYESAAAGCKNIKTWPVMVGHVGERQIMLSSPIILYDYPQISPESRGNYYDATEMDELLALSVLALSDDEKQEVRETDRHAREILDRTEALSEEQLSKLHGAIRYLQPIGGNEA
jgi:hypothetical protein